MKPRFFRTPAELRRWFEQNHAAAREILVGFHKKDSGRKSVTWPESVAEALCFGWIDGVRRRIDDDSYSIRFTPRRPASRWSAINVRLVRELEASGRMTPAGRAVFDGRRNPDSEGYSYEKRDGTLDPALERAFRKNTQAWTFFQAQPPGYRRTVCWWVMSAKQEDTRSRRLAKLLASSAAGRRLS
jgi:uncharacterized protein YdeI (YjbR/CyaY-like superfamily)